MEISPFLSKIEILASQLTHLGLQVTEAQQQALAHYIDILVEWNQRINLISRRDGMNIVNQHIAESLCLLVMVHFTENNTLLDLGSGAGFPGLPIKIVRPDLQVTLIESNRMKTLFLKKVVSELSLAQCQVVCQRVESPDVQTEYRHFFDFVVARAVTHLATLWQWSHRLLKAGARLLAMKGGDISLEIYNLVLLNAGIRTIKIPFPEAIVAKAKNRFVVEVYEKYGIKSGGSCAEFSI